MTEEFFSTGLELELKGFTTFMNSLERLGGSLYTVEGDVNKLSIALTSLSGVAPKLTGVSTGINLLAAATTAFSNSVNSEVANNISAIGTALSTINAVNFGSLVSNLELFRKGLSKFKADSATSALSFFTVISGVINTINSTTVSQAAIDGIQNLSAVAASLLKLGSKNFTNALDNFKKMPSSINDISLAFEKIANLNLPQKTIDKIDKFSGTLENLGRSITRMGETRADRGILNIANLAKSGATLDKTAEAFKKIDTLSKDIFGGLVNDLTRLLGLTGIQGFASSMNELSFALQRFGYKTAVAGIETIKQLPTAISSLSTVLTQFKGNDFKGLDQLVPVFANLTEVIKVLRNIGSSKSLRNLPQIMRDIAFSVTLLRSTIIPVLTGTTWDTTKLNDFTTSLTLMVKVFRSLANSEKIGKNLVTNVEAIMIAFNKLAADAPALAAAFAPLETASVTIKNLAEAARILSLKSVRDQLEKLTASAKRSNEEILRLRGLLGQRIVDYLSPTLVPLKLIQFSIKQLIPLVVRLGKEFVIPGIKNTVASIVSFAGTLTGIVIPAIMSTVRAAASLATEIASRTVAAVRELANSLKNIAITTLTKGLELLGSVLNGIVSAIKAVLSVFSLFSKKARDANTDMVTLNSSVYNAVGNVKLYKTAATNAANSTGALSSSLNGAKPNVDDVNNSLLKTVVTFGSLSAASGIFRSVFQQATQVSRRLFTAVISTLSEIENITLSITQLQRLEIVNSGTFATAKEAMSAATTSAANLLAEFQQLAIQSPFELTTIAKLFQMAQTFGFATDEAKALTYVVTDTAAALKLSAQDAQEVVRALGQISTSGKVSEQDLRQLSDRGIAVKRIFSNYFTELLGTDKGDAVRKAIADIGGTITDGAVSASDALELIQKGALSSGQAVALIAQSLKADFAGAAKDAGQTLSGLIASLTDLSKLSLASIFGPSVKELIPIVSQIVSLLQTPMANNFLSTIGENVRNVVVPAIKNLLSTVGTVISLWKSMPSSLQSVIKSFGLFVAVSVAATTALLGLSIIGTGLAFVFTTFLNPLTLVIAGIIGVSAVIRAQLPVINTAIERVRLFAASFLGLGGDSITLQQMIDGAIKYIVNLLISGANQFMLFGNSIATFISNSSGKIDAFIAMVVDKFTTFGSAILTTLSQIITNTGTMVTQFFTWGAGLVESFAEGMVSAVTYVVEAIATIANVITSWLAPGSPPKALPNIDTWGTAAGQEFLDGFSDADFSAINDFSSNITNLLKSLNIDTTKINLEPIVRTFAELTQSINETGTANEDLVRSISNSIPGISSELSLLVGSYTDILESTYKAEQITQQYNTAIQELEGSITSLNSQDTTANEEARIRAIQANLDSTLLNANQRIGAEKEIERIRKTQDLRNLKAQADAAKLAEDASKDQLKGLVSSINLANQFNKEITGGTGGTGLDGSSLSNGLDKLPALDTSNIISGFGDTIGDLESLLSNSGLGDGIGATLEGIFGDGGTLATSLSTAGSTISTAFDTLKQKFSDFGTQISKPFLDAGITVEALKTALISLGGGLVTAAITALVLALLPLSGPGAIAIGIITGLGAAWAIASGKINGKKIQDALKIAQDAFKTFTDALTNKDGRTISEMIDDGLDFSSISATASTLGEAFGAIVTTVTEFGTNVIDGLTTAATYISTFDYTTIDFSAIKTSVIATINGYIADAKIAAAGFGVAIVDGFKSSKSFIENSKLGELLGTALDSVIAKVKEIGASVIGLIPEDIQGSIGRYFDALRSAVVDSDVVTTLTDVVTQLGLVKGLISLFSGGGDTASGITESIAGVADAKAVTNTEQLGMNIGELSKNLGVLSGGIVAFATSVATLVAIPLTDAYIKILKDFTDQLVIITSFDATAGERLTAIATAVGQLAKSPFDILSVSITSFADAITAVVVATSDITGIVSTKDALTGVSELDPKKIDTLNESLKLFGVVLATAFIAPKIILISESLLAFFAALKAGTLLSGGFSKLNLAITALSFAILAWQTDLGGVRTVMLPILKEWFAYLTSDEFENGRKAIASLGTALATAFSAAKIAGIVTTIGSIVTALGIGAGGVGVTGLGGALTALGTFLGGPIFLAIVGAIALLTVAWKTDFLGFRTTVQPKIEAIGEWFRNLGTTLPLLFAEISTSFNAWRDETAATLTNMWSGETAQGIITAVGGLFKSIIAVFAGSDVNEDGIADGLGRRLINVFIAEFELLKATLGELWKGILDLFGVEIPNPFQFLEDSVNNIIAAWRSLLDLVGLGGGDAATSTIAPEVKPDTTAFDALISSFTNSDYKLNVVPTIDPAELTSGTAIADANTLGTNIAGGVVTGFDDKLSASSSTTDNANTRFWEAIVKMWLVRSPSKKAYNELGIPIADGIVLGFTDGLIDADISKAFTTVLSDMSDSIQNDILTPLSETIFEWLTELTDGIIVALTDFSTAVTEDTLTPLAASIIVIWDTLGTDLIASTTLTLTKIASLFTPAGNFIVTSIIALVTAMEAAYNAIIAAFTAITDAAISGIITTIRNRAVEIVSAIRSVFEEVRLLAAGGSDSYAWGVGEALANAMFAGLRKGIEDKINDIAGQVRMAIAAALKAGQEALDSNSPSRVAAKLLGEPLADGITMGIDNQAESVSNSVRNALNLATEDINMPAINGQQDVFSNLGFTYGDSIAKGIFSAIPRVASAMMAMQESIGTLTSNTSIRSLNANRNNAGLDNSAISNNILNNLSSINSSVAGNRMATVGAASNSITRTSTTTNNYNLELKVTPDQAVNAKRSFDVAKFLNV